MPRCARCAECAQRCAGRRSIAVMAEAWYYLSAFVLVLHIILCIIAAHSRCSSDSTQAIFPHENHGPNRVDSRRPRRARPHTQRVSTMQTDAIEHCVFSALACTRGTGEPVGIGGNLSLFSALNIVRCDPWAPKRHLYSTRQKGVGAIGKKFLRRRNTGANKIEGAFETIIRRLSSIYATFSRHNDA